MSSGLFNSIANNLTGAFNSLLNRNPDNPSSRYPQNLANQVAISKVTNQPEYNQAHWRESKGYVFDVVKAYPNGKTEVAPGWQPFRLQINPQELSQDEIFAIEVTPTFRGVIVEHHGTVLKDINISGTTGISPNAREGGKKKNSGDPVLASGHSGYQEFHELRSYFRAYVESKRLDNREDGKELRMVFRNLKDQENLFVEPQKFSMKRSSSRPFLYDYQIALKGIGVADAVSDSQSGLDRFLNTIDTVIAAADYIQYGAQIIQGGIGILRRTERDITSAILTPLQNINAALRAIEGGREAFLGPFGITRRFVQNIKNELERIEDNFNDLLGRDTSAYNSMKNRAPTIQGQLRESTFTEIQILNGISFAKRGVVKILAEKSLFEESIVDEADFVRDIYADQLNISEISASQSATILGDDTIQTIAARALGDPDRFKEIILLNGLKPPYVSEAGGQGVLKPGDPIILPTTQNSPRMGVRRNIDYNITRFLSETEKNFGVDIRVTEDYDFAISNTKDLDLVAGIGNMSQAVLIRLYLEPRSLKRHPQIGTDLQIGEKAVLIERLQSQIVNSLSSDLRVETIPFVGLEQEGGTILMNLLVKLRKLNQPVDIPIKVNT
jgi:hypothetical protein